MKENPPSAAESQDEREVVITKLIDAPRALVFRAWVDPRHLSQWWGPKGFTSPSCRVDARVGGEWRIAMRAPDGTEYPCGGVYLEFVEPERLVFTNVAYDRDDNVTVQGTTVVTFTAQGDQTLLVLKTRARAMAIHALTMLEGMEAGWSQSLDRMAAHCEKGDM